MAIRIFMILDLRRKGPLRSLYSVGLCVCLSVHILICGSTSVEGFGSGRESLTKLTRSPSDHQLSRSWRNSYKLSSISLFYFFLLCQLFLTYVSNENGKSTIFWKSAPTDFFRLCMMKRGHHSYQMVKFPCWLMLMLVAPSWAFWAQWRHNLSLLWYFVNFLKNSAYDCFIIGIRIEGINTYQYLSIPIKWRKPPVNWFIFQELSPKNWAAAVVFWAQFSREQELCEKHFSDMDEIVSPESKAEGTKVLA